MTTTESPPTSDHAIASLESKVAELESKLADGDRMLAQAREALDASEQRRQIERSLAEEGAVDLETATMLTEASLAQMTEAERAEAAGEEPVTRAVADLKRRKPFLFRPPAPPRPLATAMAGEPAPVNGVDEAAWEARATGDRRALLRYLRMRRS